MCHRRGRLQRQRASSRLTRKRSATQHFENQCAHHRELTTKCWVSFIDWLGHGRCELECDSIANSIGAAILRRSLEPRNEDTAVNFNDSAGSTVVWVRRDFDVFQPL